MFSVVVLVLHDPVDRGEHPRHVGLTDRVGDLDADDLRVRRHAEEVGAVARADGIRFAVKPGDDPGHVRAVTERVEVAERAVAALGGEVRTVDDLAGGAQAIDRRHAEVDERDADALAGVARVPVCVRSVHPLDVVHRVDVSHRVERRRGRAVRAAEELHRAIRSHLCHGGRGAELGNGCGRDVSDDCVDQGPICWVT